jgi:hypothetical protein
MGELELPGTGAEEGCPTQTPPNNVKNETVAANIRRMRFLFIT